MDIWEEHDLVFHYTNRAGLEGILRSQQLHATHYKCLNDTSEMLHMSPRLAEAIHPAIREEILQLAKRHPNARKLVDEDGGIDATSMKEAETLVKTLYGVTFEPKTAGGSFFEPYVSSFCGHLDEYERGHGLLSMWRSYGKESAYAVVFKTKELIEMLRKESAEFFYSGAQMGTVVYEGDQKSFEREFGKLLGEARAAYASMLNEPNPTLGDLFTQFVSSISRFKHRGFQEEKEVRIVVAPLSRAQVEQAKVINPAAFKKEAHRSVKKVEFKNGFVPHLVLFESVSEELPISKIIVGPSADKLARRVALEQYLAFRGLKIEVAVSDTPYV